jgi:hypothetical protein
MGAKTLPGKRVRWPDTPEKRTYEKRVPAMTTSQPVAVGDYVQYNQRALNNCDPDTSAFRARVRGFVASIEDYGGTHMVRIVGLGFGDCATIHAVTAYLELCQVD